MARIVPAIRMGRGFTLTKAVPQALYDGLKTAVNTTKLDDFNFADDAGIPEALIRWDTTDGHNHSDGSLSPACVGDPQITVGGSRGVQWIMTQRPGTLCIVGVSQEFPVFLEPEEEETGKLVVVNFAMHSSIPILFEPGTQPTVILTLYDAAGAAYGNTNSSANSYRPTVYLQDTNEAGFSFRYWTNDTDVGTTERKWRVFYLAMGTAPGVLADTKGVE